MNWIAPILVFGGLAALVYVLLYLKKKNLQKKHPLIYNVDIPFDRLIDPYFSTANGVTVRSVVPVPAEALQAIENGIAHQIRNTQRAKPEWTGFRNLSEYQVFLIDPHTHNVETEPGSPALLVKALNPNGVDVFTVQSAGTCIGVAGGILGGADDPRYPSIVLPHQAQEDWRFLNYLEESARFESEHIAEWGNDKQYFYSFANTGDVHPHWPDEA
jgi:hypothetical protein